MKAAIIIYQWGGGDYHIVEAWASSVLAELALQRDDFQMRSGYDPDYCYVHEVEIKTRKDKK